MTSGRGAGGMLLRRWDESYPDEDVLPGRDARPHHLRYPDASYRASDYPEKTRVTGRKLGLPGRTGTRRSRLSSLCTPPAKTITRENYYPAKRTTRTPAAPAAGYRRPRYPDAQLSLTRQTRFPPVYVPLYTLCTLCTLQSNPITPHGAFSAHAPRHSRVPAPAAGTASKSRPRHQARRAATRFPLRRPRPESFSAARPRCVRRSVRRIATHRERIANARPWKRPSFRVAHFLRRPAFAHLAPLRSTRAATSKNARRARMCTFVHIRATPAPAQRNVQRTTGNG